MQWKTDYITMVNAVNVNVIFVIRLMEVSFVVYLVKPLPGAGMTNMDFVVLVMKTLSKLWMKR